MTLETLLIYAAGALFVVFVALAMLAPVFIVLAIRARAAALERQREEDEALSRAAHRPPETDR